MSTVCCSFKCSRGCIFSGGCTNSYMKVPRNRGRSIGLEPRPERSPTLESQLVWNISRETLKLRSITAFRFLHTQSFTSSPLPASTSHRGLALLIVAPHASGHQSPISKQFTDRLVTLHLPVIVSKSWTMHGCPFSFTQGGNQMNVCAQRNHIIFNAESP